jgi:hypothetical protein
MEIEKLSISSRFFTLMQRMKMKNSLGVDKTGKDIVNSVFHVLSLGLHPASLWSLCVIPHTMDSSGVYMRHLSWRYRLNNTQCIQEF